MYRKLDKVHSQAIWGCKLDDFLSPNEKKEWGFLAHTKDQVSGKQIPITTVGDYIDHFLKNSSYKSVTEGLANTASSAGAVANVIAVLRAHAEYTDETIAAAPTRFSRDSSGTDVLDTIFNAVKEPKKYGQQIVDPYMYGHLMIMCASMHGKYFDDDPNKPKTVGPLSAAFNSVAAPQRQTVRKEYTNNFEIT